MTRRRRLCTCSYCCSDRPEGLWRSATTWYIHRRKFPRLATPAELVDGASAEAIADEDEFDGSAEEDEFQGDIAEKDEFEGDEGDSDWREPGTDEGDDDPDERSGGCYCADGLLPSGLPIDVIVRHLATLASRSKVSRTVMSHIFFIIALILPDGLVSEWPNWRQVLYKLQKTDRKKVLDTCVHDHVLFTGGYSQLRDCPVPAHIPYTPLRTRSRVVVVVIVVGSSSILRAFLLVFFMYSSVQHHTHAH